MSAMLRESLVNGTGVGVVIVLGGFRVTMFLTLLTRLITQAKRKVFFVVDRHPVHRAKIIQVWRAAQRADLEISYLPG